MPRTCTLLIQASLLPALALAGCSLASHGYAIGTFGVSREKSCADCEPCRLEQISCVEFAGEKSFAPTADEDLEDSQIHYEVIEESSAATDVCETCDPVVAIPLAPPVRIENAPLDLVGPGTASKANRTVADDSPTVRYAEELCPSVGPPIEAPRSAGRAVSQVWANYDSPHARPKVLPVHGPILPGRRPLAGAVHGIAARIAAHEKNPPEAERFVVYERVSPKFLPVPTRPVFESPTAPASMIEPLPAPLPMASLAPRTQRLRPAPDPFSGTAVETLPRPLSDSSEALPIPPPDASGLPPAPRIDDLH